MKTHAVLNCFSFNIRHERLSSAPVSRLQLTDRAKSRRLLQRMTLAEKIGQMTQLNLTVYNSSGHQTEVDIVPEKFIPLVRDYHVGSFLNGSAVSAATWLRYGEQLQRLNLEHSRLKIPLIYGVDHVHGANYLNDATFFPQPINLAATFNDTHSEHMGEVTGREVAGLGHHWIFAPILDVGVNPYWPRFYETFGSEPRVASRMGSTYIAALQKPHQNGPQKLAATAKHFLGYSASDSGWDRTPAQIPDQYLHEIFVPPFRAAVNAGVRTVMINSAEINGIPTHANKSLLTDLLRNDLGFEGVAVTDWEDILYLVHRHRVAETESEATQMAIEAGVDMSMTATTLTFPKVLEELVERGVVTQERIDRSVRRILSLKFELGLFEEPYPTGRLTDTIGSAQHLSLARAAARDSIVLLKNENSRLPATGRVAILGPQARSRRVLSGGWTLNHQGKPEEEYPTSIKTVEQAVSEKLDQIVEPEEADLLLVVVGEDPYAEGSGDIVDLAFDESQQEVLERAVRYKKPIVLVVLGGRPRLITQWIDDCDAVIWAGLPGFEGADAIAEILTGETVPSGRLPFNYPSAPGHLVPYHHKALSLIHISEPTRPY